jgi:cyclopropane-fatty-acyl-phospholipid synthase
MATTSYEKLVREVLASADVKINGNRSWDIQVKDAAFYKRLAGGGSLAGNARPWTVFLNIF